MSGVATAYGEDDLWDLLARILSDEPPPEPYPLRVSQWQPRILYFPDEPMGHTVTPTMAKAILGFHSSLARSYSYLVYGRPNARLLRTADQTLLDLRALVTSGSDGVEIVAEDLGRLATGMLSKMTGRQITIGLVLYMLLHFGTTLTTSWIHERYEAKRRDTEAHERIALSEQATTRLKLVEEALQRHPGLRPLADMSSDGKESLVRSVAKAPRSQILGADITSDQAESIISNPKEKGHGKRLDGIYKVTDIDTKNPFGHRARLENVATHAEILVSINEMELSPGDVDAMFGALRDKTTIQATINAYVIGERVDAASIVRADSVTIPPMLSPPTPALPDKPEEK